VSRLTHDDVVQRDAKQLAYEFEPLGNRDVLGLGAGSPDGWL
jgi:hypothetical protein